ncbi:MAG TPA: glycosyltransferase [Kutzneria sp.]|nr:glycosyltransferase [Kutzneria sp.]
MTSTAQDPLVTAGATTRHMRVVIGADTYPPDVNGAATFAARLAVGLAERGHDVHVLCPSTNAHAGRATAGGVTVHRISSMGTPVHPTFRICHPVQARRAARALLDEIKPDLVHIQAHFIVGRALAHSARRRRVPLVATNHFMPENLHGYLPVPKRLRPLVSQLGWWDLRQVLRHADAVTAPTPRAVQLLADNGVPAATAVSCGIDLNRFPTAGSMPDHLIPHVLFVGRLDQEKRVDDLLRAVHLIRANVQVRVEIVGDGKRRAAWQELAGRLGISGNVTFHGHVDEDALIAAYRRADVFCMPGVAELQSLATMDALAAGKPVIAADAMALPHLVRPGETGWLYPPGDVAALAGRLRQLLNDGAGRARMGAAGRELISQHTMASTLDHFEDLYRDVAPVALSQ